MLYGRNEPSETPGLALERFDVGAPAHSRQTRVILIEQDPHADLRVTAMLRTLQGTLDVLRTTSVADALSLIPPASTSTCVLLNLSSASDDGFDGLETLRRFAPHAPVVALVGHDDDTACLRALAAGAHDYLVLDQLTPEILRRSIRYAGEHQTSQDALHDASERFRLAFQDSPLGIALISVTEQERGRVMDANPAFAAILGSGLETLVGHDIMDRVHPMDAGQFALDLRALGSGEAPRVRGRRRLIGSAAKAVLCSFTASVLRDQSGEPTGVIAMFDDVTGETRREEELGQALDALDKAAYGIALLDITGKYLSVNRAHAAALGREELELVGATWESAVHPSDRETARQAMGRASGGDGGKVEVRGLRSGGSTFDAEVEFVARNDREGRLVGLHFFLRDVSERKSLDRALRCSKDHYERVVETANEGVWITDDRQVTTFVNQAMCEMLGFTPADLVGNDAADLVVAEDRDRVLAAIGTHAGGSPQRLDVRLRHADGHQVWSLMATSALEREGAATSTLAMVTDITERKRAELALAHVAQHDGLTGLPNREVLVDRLQQALDRAGRQAQTVGLFFIDLDRFKNVNDSLGHEAGDTLLKTLGTRLCGALRTTDTLARFGGDEFVVLCPDLVEQRDALTVVERLFDALQEPVETGSGPVDVTLSVGVAISEGDGLSAEEVIRDADIAMYRAKLRAGSSYELFDCTMRAELLSQLRIEQEIGEALLRDQFTLTYQPILSLHDQCLAGCEALIRWSHPERGALAPSEFIPVAERTGLIVQIGDWVLQEACRQMACWDNGASSLGGAKVWVNASAKQFDDPLFPSRVAATLAATGIEASRLCLEVTETALVDLRSQTAPRVMDELKALGVELVLDDFGTGYSSLSYIRQLPIAGLKLDRSFVSQIGTDDAVLPIVEAVSGMARSLGLSLVAEGVETETQLKALYEYGCELAQGFYFARPMTAEDLLEWDTGRSATDLHSNGHGNAQSVTVALGEAASHLGVAASTVRRWADCGRLGSLRTPGGHRRIFSADVRREARRLTPGVELNQTSAPLVCLPALSELLATRGESILAVVAGRVYASSTPGWFGLPSSKQARSDWAAALSGSCRSGRYTEGLEASAIFLRRASMGGATSLERHLYLERVRAAVDYLLREASASAEELTGARALMTAIQHQALGET